MAEKQGRNLRRCCQFLLLQSNSKHPNSSVILGSCIAVPVSKCTRDSMPIGAGLTGCVPKPRIQRSPEISALTTRGQYPCRLVQERLVRGTYGSCCRQSLRRPAVETPAPAWPVALREKTSERFPSDGDERLVRFRRRPFWHFARTSPPNRSALRQRNLVKVEGVCRR
jgi:hypothetical protein